MDPIGSVPASYDECLIAWTPMWHFVRICMSVSPLCLNTLLTS